MRPPQHKQRGRNRHRIGGGGGGGSSSSMSGGNPLTRVYESNGPDVKVRGNAQTVADKYLQLGRDAQSSSDIVMAESYYQYAEHYLRIVSAAQAYQQQMQPQQQFRDDDDEDSDNPAQPQMAEQPEVSAEQPFEAERPQQQQFNRPPREQGFNRNNRPRWQDRRDQSQPNGNVEQRPVAVQPRFEEQPPPVQATPAPAAREEPGQWEAPSFLMRPAPLPPVTEPDEVAAAPTPVRRPRKPRVVAVPTAD